MRGGRLLKKGGGAFQTCFCNAAGPESNEQLDPVSWVPPSYVSRFRGVALVMGNGPGVDTAVLGEHCDGVIVIENPKLRTPYSE